MEEKLINSEFEHDIIKVLRCLVPDQTMRLEENASGPTRIWKSYCIGIEGMAITTIVRDGIIVAKIVYDYENGDEKEWIY